MHRKLIVLLLVMLLALFAGTAHAQASVPPFASVEDGTLTLTDAEGNTRPVISAASFAYLAWNADHSQLAFIMRDENFVASIGVVDAASGAVTLLNTPSLESGYNLSWLADGRILFAAINPASNPSETPGMKVDLFALEPQAGAQPQLLGTYDHGVGCGGGSNIPADWAYWSETAGFGGFFLTLAETPYGIVHSMDCGGSTVGLFDPATGITTQIASNYAKVIVSPDGERLAGVELNYTDRSASRLLVYSLATQEFTEVATAGEPNQMAWSADGQSLYYSVRTPGINLVDGLDTDQKAALNQIFGFDVAEIPAYTTRIHQVTLANGEDVEFYSGDTYAVGRMIEVGDALYFSIIPNIGEWLEQLLAGEVAYDTFGSIPASVAPAVLRLAPAESPEAALLGMHDQFTPVTGQ
ncbi:MAG: PD40 domain-containing protein [Anaerolineae bacterium]|nr:PD40 domain-containing protein [Anaerolineae bacterium]